MPLGNETRLADAEKNLIIHAAIENKRIIGIATQDGRLARQRDSAKQTAVKNAKLAYSMAQATQSAARALALAQAQQVS